MRDPKLSDTDERSCHTHKLITDHQLQRRRRQCRELIQEERGKPDIFFSGET